MEQKKKENRNFNDGKQQGGKVNSFADRAAVRVEIWIQKSVQMLYEILRWA